MKIQFIIYEEDDKNERTVIDTVSSKDGLF